MPTTRSRKTAKTPVARGNWEATLRNVRAANTRMHKLHTQQERDLAALRTELVRLDRRVLQLEHDFVQAVMAAPPADEVTQ